MVTRVCRLATDYISCHIVGKHMVFNHESNAHCDRYDVKEEQYEEIESVTVVA